MQRLVAFFATGDSIVANNLVLNLYQHINAPEARMYLSRQLYEEALHVQFYLTLLDTYVPDPRGAPPRLRGRREHPLDPRRRPSSASRWIDSDRAPLDAARDARASAGSSCSNLICFAACIEGLFFFGAFAYVYFLRSRGLLHGLAAGTNWVFRDESAHMAFAFEVVKTVRARRARAVRRRALEQIVDRDAGRGDRLRERSSPRICSAGGVAGLSVRDVRRYLEFCADQRLVTLGMPKRYGAKNPFAFMDLQDVSGGHELLRAPRLGVPGRRQRRGRVRRGLLTLCEHAAAAQAEAPRSPKSG